MTEREKILREGLENIHWMAHERVRIKEALRLIEGIASEILAKADAAPKDGWVQVGWAWKQGDQFFFTDISNRPRTGFPIYAEPPK